MTLKRTLSKGDRIMKKISLISAVLASVLLLGACGDKKEAKPEATPTPTPVTTESVATEESEPEEEVEMPEYDGELTVENYFYVDPSETEWGQTSEASYLINLVDLDYIKESMGDVFKVDSIEDLASLTYFVNTYPAPRTGDDKMFIKVDLLCDIDINGEDWAPLGIYDEDHSKAFCGLFSANGHTIKNIYISSDDEQIGFFGDIVGSTVCGLRLEEAFIFGKDSAMMAGHMYDARFFDCHVVGYLPDSSDFESVFIFPANVDPGNNRFLDCSMDVTNGDNFTYKEEIDVNPYDEGMDNAFINLYDPDKDGVYEYNVSYYEQ